MLVKPFFLKYRARLPAMNPPAPVMTIKIVLLQRGVLFHDSFLFLHKFVFRLFSP